MKKKNLVVIFILSVFVFACFSGCDMQNPIMEEWWEEEEPEVPDPGSSGGGWGGGYGGGGGTPTPDPLEPIPVPWTVIFNSNGGDYIDLVDPNLNTRTDPPEQKRYTNTLAREPGLVEKTGEYFKGWYKTKEAADNLDESGKWDFNTAITENITLYAGWDDEGTTVSFDVDSDDNEDSAGGSSPAYSIDFDGGEPDIDSATPGKKLSYTPVVANIANGGLVPEPTGFRPADGSSPYVFAGWFKDKGLTDPWNLETDTVGLTPIILHAKWEKIDATGKTSDARQAYAVEFMDPNTVYPNLTEYKLAGEKVPKPSLPTKENYIFEGWYPTPDCSGPEWDFASNNVETLTSTGTTDASGRAVVRLYAKWDIAPYSDPWFDDIKNCLQINPPGGYNTAKYFPFQLDAEGTGEGAYDFIVVSVSTDATDNFNTMETVQNLLKSDESYIARIVGYSTDPLVLAQRELDAWWNICGDETGVNRTQVVINTKLPDPYNPLGGDPPISGEMRFGNNASNSTFTDPTSDEVKVYLYMRR